MKKRKMVNWTWEDPDAQSVFAEWVGFSGEQKTSEQVDKIEALLSIQPSQRVLDLGCGTGRHALEMARRGYTVVGIDIARRYLEQAQREAMAQLLPVEFRLQRGSDLTDAEEFDVAIAFNHTLGFMTSEELDQHFRRVWTSLKHQGRFLLVLAGPRLLPGRGSERTKDWAEKNGKFILSEKYVDQGYRIELSIVIDTNTGDITEFHERQKAFALDDVVSLLEHTGFAQIKCFADLDGNPATPQSFGVFACRKENSE